MKKENKVVPIPKVGDVLHVRHRSDHNGRLAREKKHEVRSIVGVYLGGTVKDSAGDVWEVAEGRGNFWVTTG